MYFLYIAVVINIGAGREQRIKPEKIEALAMVKSIYRESNSSAGARTVSSIATTRGLPMSRYIAGRLMKELI